MIDLHFWNITQKTCPMKIKKAVTYLSEIFFSSYKSCQKRPPATQLFIVPTDRPLAAPVPALPLAPRLA